MLLHLVEALMVNSGEAMAMLRSDVFGNVSLGGSTCDVIQGHGRLTLPNTLPTVASGVDGATVDVRRLAVYHRV